MLDIQRLFEAIREEGLAGWLICNNHHRDEIADLVLGVSRERTNTRPWVCLLPAAGEPVKIVHAMEAGILDGVPGRAMPYSTRAQFTGALASALPRGVPLAANFSVNTPVSSFLDYGTALLVQSLGVTLVSAESLIARSLGAIDERGFDSHQAAAAVLYRIVPQVWSRLARAVQEGNPVREGEVRDWIVKEIADAGLVSDSVPIVAAGPHSGNPHFEGIGPGSKLEPGDVVQFDLWAREPQEGAVYADISWVGVVGTKAQSRATGDLPDRGRSTGGGPAVHRGRACGRASWSGERTWTRRPARPSRAEGTATGLRHRTGHSIGGRVHGFGVNLDSVEFPDRRALRDGACFSVEPGLYGSEFGMRTEVDCCIRGGRLVVTGAERQRNLLVLA